MRCRLEKGTRIELLCDGVKKVFQIDDILGDGAGCIAYDAHRVGSLNEGLKYRIKECYPFGAQVKREGLQLIWQDKMERENAFSRLTKTHDLFITLHNSEEIGNHITKADLCEGNGTLYSVMEVNYAKTYANDTATDLPTILETILCLSKIIQNLHAKGYLHLDLKPDNFLVTHTPNTNIWLFDLDSLTSMEELANGEVKALPFSQKWAAPEQVRGQISKISPATDIFSIGSILFEKIMGRPVEDRDMSLFAEWELPANLFSKVNPKVGEIVQELFRKTLSATAGKRYGLTDNLISTLEEALYLLKKGIPYIISNVPNYIDSFIGREKELIQIENSFSSGKRVVYLYGFGGIGKSELAKRYAALHKNNYDAIVFFRYKDDLRTLIYEIEVQNCDYLSSEKDRIKTLRQIFNDNKVLLIIDNFDVLPEDEEFLEEVLSFSADFIFTTRTNFSEFLDSKSIQLVIEPLEKNELLEIFQNEQIRIDENNKTDFEKLLRMLQYHTLATVLIAKQMKVSEEKIEQIIAKLEKKGIGSFKRGEKVRINKDGKVVRNDFYDIIKNTFFIAELSDVEKAVLINLYFLQFLKVSKNIYRKYYAVLGDELSSHIDAISDLVLRGWISLNSSKPGETEYELHPLILQIIEEELNVDIVRNKSLVSYIETNMKFPNLNDTMSDRIFDELTELEKDQIRVKVNWFVSLSIWMLSRSTRNIAFIIELLYEIIDANLYFIELFPMYESKEDKISKLLTILFKKTKEYDLDTKHTFMLNNLLETATFVPFGALNLKDENRLYYFEKLDTFIRIQLDCVECLEEEEQKRAICMICKPLFQHVGSICITTKELIKPLVLEMEGYHEMVKEFYRLTENDAGWDLDWILKSYEDDLIDVYDENPGEQQLEMIRKTYVKRYFNLNTETLDEFIEEILDNTQLSDETKGDIFMDILRESFPMCGWNDNWGEYLSHFEQLDWARVLKIYDAGEPFFGICADNAFTYYTVAAVNNEETSLDSEMALEVARDSFLEYAKRYPKHYCIRHFEGVTDPTFCIISRGFGNTMYWLSVTGKNHVVVKELIKCANVLESMWKEEPDYSEDWMYCWYKCILEFAEEAALSGSIEQFSKMREIENEYQKKVKALTKEDFEIKF